MKLRLKKTLAKVVEAVGFYSDKTYDAGGVFRVRRVWNAVNISYRGTARAYSTNAYNLIAVLGPNERPSDTVNFTAYNNNTSDVTKAPLVGYINTSGQVYIWVYSGQTNVAPFFNVTFLKSGGYCVTQLLQGLQRFSHRSCLGVM